MNSAPPFISVIITCYNHGRYLSKSIRSVIDQGYDHFEVIVVDDGSTDNTATIAKSFPKVRYVYQQNAGLSSARNKGIAESKGSHLIFLDADDWLFPRALGIQANEAINHPDSMAVVGNFKYVNEDETNYTDGRIKPKYQDHYCDLLESNLVAMHASVLFRKEFFNAVQYDSSLKAGEDYDVLLKLTRQFPIHFHEGMIAAYRQHDQNMSKDVLMMLSNVLSALKKQEHLLRSEDEKKCYENGLRFWNYYFADTLVWLKMKQIYENRVSRPLLTQQEKNFIVTQKPEAIGTLNSLLRKQKIKRFAKTILGEKGFQFLRRRGKTNNQLGKIQWGSFDRTEPFSTNFGFDRGKPIDRFYIEEFLAEQSHHIRGRVLEIGDNAYTLKYGGAKVERSDVLHISPNHPSATIIGDLSKREELPIDDNTYDCIVLTQTLHLIPDYEGALRQCYRILKSGGVLLLTSPGVSPIDKGEWVENWLWSFNRSSMELIVKKNFKSSNLHMKVYGNVFTATAFLWGLSVQEIPQPQKFSIVDESFPVIVAVCLSKE